LALEFVFNRKNYKNFLLKIYIEKEEMTEIFQIGSITGKKFNKAKKIFCSDSGN